MPTGPPTALPAMVVTARTTTNVLTTTPGRLDQIFQSKKKWRKPTFIGYNNDDLIKAVIAKEPGVKSLSTQHPTQAI